MQATYNYHEIHKVSKTVAHGPINSVEMEICAGFVITEETLYLTFINCGFQLKSEPRDINHI